MKINGTEITNVKINGQDINLLKVNNLSIFDKESLIENSIISFKTNANLLNLTVLTGNNTDFEVYNNEVQIYKGNSGNSPTIRIPDITKDVIIKGRAIKEFTCNSSQMIQLDVTQATKLEKLYVNYSALTFLNLQENNNLKDVALHCNRLSDMYWPSKINFTKLDISTNCLYNDKLLDLVFQLAFENGQGKKVYLFDYNSNYLNYDEENFWNMTGKLKNLYNQARSKGWTFYEKNLGSNSWNIITFPWE